MIVLKCHSKSRSVIHIFMDSFMDGINIGCNANAYGIKCPLNHPNLLQYDCISATGREFDELKRKLEKEKEKEVIFDRNEELEEEI